MKKNNLSILTIGVDQEIFNKSSRVYRRVKEYASLVSQYTVFVFTKKKVDRFTDGNFEVIPVLGRNKFTQVVKLFVLFKREFSNISQHKRVLSSQDPFEIGFLSFILSKCFYLPLHIQVHTDISSPLFKKETLRQRFQLYISSFILKKVKSIRVVSTRIESFLVNHLGIDKDKIVNAPVYIQRIDIPKVEKQKNLIVSIGRLEKVKNISMLIESFEIIASSISDAELLIFGDGKQRMKLASRIAISRYKNRIILNGSVTNPFEFMAKASVFAISSNFEGYAVTAVESVLSGTPVCVTPVGCAGEFIVDGINGFVSPSFSAEDFAKTLEKTMKFVFGDVGLKRSLESLLTKEEYFKRLVDSWNKAL